LSYVFTHNALILRVCPESRVARLSHEKRRETHSNNYWVWCCTVRKSSGN